MALTGKNVPLTWVAALGVVALSACDGGSGGDECDPGELGFGSITAPCPEAGTESPSVGEATV